VNYFSAVIARSAATQQSICPVAFTRPIEIQNRHPRLRAPAAQIRRAIALLDENFRVVPADLATFSPAIRTRLRLLSSIRSSQSTIAPACPPGELSLVFLTDPALAQLHADFMDDPSATDVITFEGDPSAELAGEICVSADTAHAYAREHRRDFATELTLYLVHGWLHLAGYDDLRPAKKRRMRAAEARAMKILSAHAAIPAFVLAAPKPPRRTRAR
jgi:probable rRNA maturation factor